MKNVTEINSVETDSVTVAYENRLKHKNDVSKLQFVSRASNIQKSNDTIDLTTDTIDISNNPSSSDSGCD